MKPKKTIEYLGKLEKAVKDQYGDEAIMNPRELWSKEKEEEYYKQIKESAEKEFNNEAETDRIEETGFLVSKKLINKGKSDGCPVCYKYLTNFKDSVYIIKFQCCNTCYIKYVENREERWKDGWRPESNRKTDSST